MRFRFPVPTVCPLPGPLWRTVEVSIAVLTFAIFLFYFSLCAFRVTWGWDFQVYISGVSALYENFLHPGHENMPVAEKFSMVYTPYLLAVSAMGRWFSLSEYAALQWAGVFNLILYSVSILVYFRCTSLVRHSFLPAVFFLVVSLTLRNLTYTWSSETSFDTLRFILAYPSFFAWSLALLIFSAAEMLLRNRRKTVLILMVVLLWILILTHQITASWVIGVIVVRCLFEVASRQGTKSFSEVYALAASIVLALALAFFWPYSSLFELSGHVSVTENPPFGKGMNPVMTFASLYLLAVPSFCLILQSKRGKLLLWSFLATIFAFLFFKITNLQYGYRYVFFAAFFAQVAVSEVSAIGVLSALRTFKRSIKNRRLPSWASVFTCLVAILTFVAISNAPLMKGLTATLLSQNALNIKELLLQHDPAEAYYSMYTELHDTLGKDDIVLIHPGDNLSYQLAVLTGARSIVVEFGFLAPDYSKRKQAVNDFLSPATPWSERLAVIRTFGVTKVLLTRGSGTLGIGKELVEHLGPPTLETDNLMLFSVQP
jgi:hypothetical protein